MTQILDALPSQLDGLFYGTENIFFRNVFIYHITKVSDFRLPEGQMSVRIFRYFWIS